MSLAMLKRLRFFRSHDVFAVVTPDVQSYGRAVDVQPDEPSIGWFNGRGHRIGVVRVGENTATRLVVTDTDRRRYEFRPMTLAYWNRNFPSWAFDTLAQVEAYIRNE